QRPVQIPRITEGTSIGTAIYAAVGAGIYKSASEAAGRLIKIDRTYEPDKGKGEIYQAAYARWREIYRRCFDMVEDGLLPSMWQAGGTMSRAQKENPWKL
ncbi:MAG: hypothetical protein LBQ61_03860, partial [Spirochaetales bacterium]|nr:hypothetical protein [Spirochaetales bacterium]